MTEDKLSVRDVVKRRGSKKLFHIEPGITMKEAAHAMQLHDVSAICVTKKNGEEQTLLGIVSEKDVARLVADGTEPEATMVDSVMSTEIITTSIDTPLWETAKDMLAHSIRHLPVLEEETPVTMISIRDVLAILAETLWKENEYLRAEADWLTYMTETQ